MNTLSLHGYSNNKGRDLNDRLCLAIFCNTYSSWYSHDEKVQSLMFKYLTANTVDFTHSRKLYFVLWIYLQYYTLKMKTFLKKVK